jgi:hypothetical protein
MRPSVGRRGGYRRPPGAAFSAKRGRCRRRRWMGCGKQDVWTASPHPIRLHGRLSTPYGATFPSKMGKGSVRRFEMVKREAQGGEGPVLPNASLSAEWSCFRKISISEHGKKEPSMLTRSQSTLYPSLSTVSLSAALLNGIRIGMSAHVETRRCCRTRGAAGLLRPAQQATMPRP